MTQAQKERMTVNEDRQTQADNRVVERTIRIEAPVDAVWKAITEAAELERWFPTEARVTPGVGGEIWMSWGDMYEHASTIEAWEPGQHLRARFPVVGKGALATDYYLEGDGGSTILRVVTSGFGPGADWDDDYKGVTFGWAFELEGLRHYLEQHPGQDRGVIRIQRQLTDPPAALWDRVIGADAFFDARIDDAGARYTGTMGGVEVSGRIINHAPPTQFVGTIDEMDNALFRFEIESHGPGDLWVWVSTYGLDEERLAALEADWTERIDTLMKA